MSTLITEVISSIVQVLLFSLIPFIVWLLTARKKESFFSWIGFKKAISNKKECAKFAAVAVIICLAIGIVVYKFFLNSDWNKSTYAGLGFIAIPCSILNSYVHTALSEEILFRGFIQKRLQSVLNFKVATIIQAVLFGFAHIVLLLDKITFVEALGLVIFPILPGILFAYTNEKKGDGSIIPGWLMHGSMNFLRDIIVALFF